MEDPREVMQRPRHARRLGPAGDGNGGYEASGSGASQADSPQPARRAGRSRRWLRVTGVVVALLLGLLVAAWAVDVASGGVPRNVRLAGVPVGGLAEDALPVRVAEIADRFASVPVEIDTGRAAYLTTAGELGLEVDERATADAALRIDDDTFLFARPFAWLASFVQERHAKLRLRVDEARLGPAVIALEGADRVPPTEPSMELTEEGLVLVPGVPGMGLLPATVARTMPREVASATEPIRIEVAPEPVPPTAGDDEALAAIEHAKGLTQEPLRVLTPGGDGEIPTEVLRSWLLLAVDEEGTIAPTLDPNLVREDLPEVVTDLAGAPVDASFVVEGGRVRIVGHRDGAICCAEGSEARIVEALLAGRGEVELELRTGPPAFTTADAEALRIVEEIGSPDAFGPTTRFACCEPRVQNIHRIADLVRGAVIRPGETFSVNRHVGRRTRERGFVEAGVIYEGRFQTAVGGGVSQFATSLFNAALFAGLDFAAYQSHSIYIARYPRGHEATISFPQPDLAIINSTPYGVLIWPEYTDTSITVRLFSTRHATVSIESPTPSPAGRCTRWTTPRTRTYPDGRVEHDSVFALYRPAEGVNC